MTAVLSDKESVLIDAYWRAANYLSVGQIYLFDNPLLKRPLEKTDVKPRVSSATGARLQASTSSTSTSTGSSKSTTST